MTAPATASATADPAVRRWQAVVDAAPGDVVALTNLGAACLWNARRSGDFQMYARAEAALRAALNREPDHAVALAGLASALVARGDYRGAAATAQRLVDAAPEQPEGLALLGDALVELGETARAEAAYVALAERSPGTASATRLARVRQLRGDAAGAADVLAAAARDAEAAGAGPADRAAALVALGHARFIAGAWDEADRHYRAAQTLAPDAVDVLDHLTELRAAEGRFDEAAALYERAVAALPRPPLMQALGDVLIGGGRAAEARSWHRRALAGYLAAAAEGNPAYYHHLAAYYSDVEPNGDEAVRWARRDLELRQTGHAYDALARALQVAGRPAEAARAADEAVARAAHDAHVLYRASRVYFAAGDARKARDCLRRAAAANPKFNAFHVHR